MTKTQAAFVANIRALRDQKNYSQAELAEKCGLSTVFISQIEQGVKFPSIENIEVLAGALGVKVFSLFMSETDFFDFSKDAQTLIAEIKNNLPVSIDATLKSFLTRK